MRELVMVCAVAVVTDNSKLVKQAQWAQSLGIVSCVQLAAHWDTVAIDHSRGGLLLIDLAKLIAIRDSDRPPARLLNDFAAWRVVAVWIASRPAPADLRRMTRWGIVEHVDLTELNDIDYWNRLLLSARIDQCGSLLVDTLLARTISDRFAVRRIAEATLAGLTCGEIMVQSLEKRLFRSASSLRRDMKRLGLPTPGRWIQGFRLSFAILLQSQGFTNAEAAQVLHFSSTGALTKQIRRVRHRGLGDVQSRAPHSLPDYLVSELLLRRPR